MLLDTNCKALSNGSIYLTFNKYTLDFFLIDEPCFRILDQQFPISFEKLVDSFSNKMQIVPKDGLQRIQLLLEKGIIFVKQEKHENLTNLRKIQKTPLRKRFEPTNIYLSIVQDCNLKCDYCSAGHGRFGGKVKYMDKPTAQRSLDLLLNSNQDNKIRSVTFAGGEPLLNTETLFFSLEYGTQLANKHNLPIYFSFNSNGTLLTEEISEELTKYPVYVTLSLDGTREIHDAHRRFPNGEGSYDLAVKNFKVYCEKMKKRHGNFFPRIQCCLPLGKGLYKSFCNLKQLGASMLVINPAWPSSFVEHNLEIDKASFSSYLAEYELILRNVIAQLENTPNESRCVMASTAESINQLSEGRTKSLGCGAGNDSFAIGPDGNIYPCGLFFENKKYCIGNIWTEICLDKILSVQQEISDLSSKCSNCWAVSFCGAACLPMAIAQGCENSLEPTCYCDLFRGYIERDILLYAELYLRFGSTQFVDFSSNSKVGVC